MLSPLHASLPSNAGVLLIAAISGRALAAAARRAGYRPFVADLFCDTDTVALAERAESLKGDLRSGIDGAQLIPTLRALAGEEQPVAVVLGSGFERRPELVDEIGNQFPLAGNRGSTIRRVKDPQALSDDCAALGIPHPEFQWEAPPDPRNWVAKTVGAAGGQHVKQADATGPCTAGRYFQRFIPGKSISALFVADGKHAQIVGFSRQWTSPAPTAPYRYGGAVRIRRFDRRETTMIEGWLSSLADRAGLLGLCSADFIRSEDGFWLVEVNPRPGATLDIFDSPKARLMDLHLNATRGNAWYRLPRFTDSMASMIAYAADPIPYFPALDWPDWTADHQSEGTSLAAGDPVCTVFARGPSAVATQRMLEKQAKQLKSLWEGTRR